MEIRLLGPLEVVVDGSVVPIAGRRQRALLARLALDANRTVAVERLIDDLWGESPPDSSTKIVQIGISYLRKALPPDTIRTSPPGYLLVVEEDGIDLGRVERLRQAGNALLEQGEPQEAALVLREALGLWRGEALGEFTEPFARIESARLEEMRLACVEARIEAELAAGLHEELVAELEAFVGRHPLRERLRRQHVMALYRTGRHADALASYAAYRDDLDEMLGIEPSVEMRELERRILNQDPTLELTGERPVHPVVHETATTAPPRPVDTLKTSPPSTPPWYVERPRIEALLAEATARRLVVVMAGAGFGKTTALAARARAEGWAWYTVDADDASAEELGRGIVAALGASLELGDFDPSATTLRDASGADDTAATIAAALEEVGSRPPLVLVLDDLHELGRDTPGASLVDSLVRYAPSWLHIVVGSREDVPFPVSRLRGTGGVLDLRSADLVFAQADVERLLDDRVGADARVLASELIENTGGWPVAVYLACEALRGATPDARPLLLRALTLHSATLVEYLAEEVVARLEAPAHDVLVHVAVLRGATRTMLTALGLEQVDEGLAVLVRHGLVTRPLDAEGEHTTHALIREYVVEGVVAPDDAREIRARAARWELESGDNVAALHRALEGPDVELVVEILNDPFSNLTSRGHTDLVLRAVEALPEADRRRASNQTVSHAYLIRGELTKAQEAVDAWAASGVPDDGLDVLALQRAMLAIARGLPQEALDALLERGPDTPLFASAFVTYQLLTLGRLEEAEAFAERAVGLVREPDQFEWDVHEAYAALGEVRLARGRYLEAEELVRVALDHARRWDNGLAVTAHLCRLSTVRLVRGDATEALALATEALGLADRIGFGQYQGVARTAQSRALARLARLDDAMEAARAAVAFHGNAPSFDVVWPLILLGRLHTERGEVAQARSTLERARAIAQRAQAPAADAMASSVLARLLVPEAPSAGKGLLPHPEGTSALQLQARFEVLLASGWIAVGRGDATEALARATEVIELSGAAGDVATLAEGIALRAFARQDVGQRVADLRDAVATLAGIDAPLELAVTTLALDAAGGAVDADARARARAMLAEQAVRLPSVSVGLAAMVREASASPVTIRTFGRFSVQLEGATTEPAGVRETVAHDLLQLLVSRRGAGVSHRSVADELWPDDRTESAERTEAAVAALRDLLDPAGRYAADWFVVDEPAGIRLVREHLTIDVEVFLGRARRALDALASGASDARRLLEEAERAYGGALFGSEAELPWARALQEETRSAYADVLRALARDETASDRFHLRLLALDPADEEVHLGLIRMLADAGRHGEARRAHRRYVQQMRELRLEPVALDAAING